MPSFQLQTSGKTDIGRRRASNQDRFLVDDSIGLFAVADGMGGHQGGEIASTLALEVLGREMEKPGFDQEPELKLEQAIREANREVFQKGREKGFPGMGTTLTALFIKNEVGYVGHVGDSRLLLFREGELFQITEDHSQIYELMKAGLLNESNAHLVQRNVITRSVGFDANVNIDILVRPVSLGDRYLICSDGLSGMVSPQEIAQVMMGRKPIECVDLLVELANLKGGDDNITVVEVDCS